MEFSIFAFFKVLHKWFDSILVFVLFLFVLLWSFTLHAFLGRNTIEWCFVFVVEQNKDKFRNTTSQHFEWKIRKHQPNVHIIFYDAFLSRLFVLLLNSICIKIISKSIEGIYTEMPDFMCIVIVYYIFFYSNSNGFCYYIMNGTLQCERKWEERNVCNFFLLAQMPVIHRILLTLSFYISAPLQ